MKTYLKFIKLHGSAALLCCIVLIVSCTDKFDEINTNKNRLANLGSAQLPFLFSKAEQMGTGSGWNYQIAQNLFHDQYVQYFSNTTTYFPSDRLVIRMDWIPAAWNPIYTQTMPQLQTLMEEYDPSSAEYALANIWWVESFHRVADTWGPIPYFQAGIPAAGVPYDDMDVIYDDFFKRLTDAVTVLKGKTGETPYGDYDIIYTGDVSKWIAFANSLRLRLAVRISKVDEPRGQTEAEAAVASGVMTTSPAHDALVKKSNTGGDINGLSVMDWNEFRMSAAMESVLKGYSDPRMPVYFQPTQTSILANQADPSKPLEYHGLRNGLTSGQMAITLNKPENNSRHGARWNSSSNAIRFLGKDYPSGLEVPVNVMCAAESWFNRAEGVLLGWNMGGGTAKQYYEMGITTSMNQWGITDAAAISAYINSSALPVAPQDALSSPAAADVPVLFGASAPIQQKQITLQKWLALYPDGVEAWADQRRSGVIKLYPVANSDNPDLPNPTVQYIRRINYITDEKTTNGPEVTKAVQLLGPGGDKITTPLWWDKN
jgi:hypothetical protein